jgi:hypothetical protein
MTEDLDQPNDEDDEPVSPEDELEHLATWFELAQHVQEMASLDTGKGAFMHDLAGQIALLCTEQSRLVSEAAQLNIGVDLDTRFEIHRRWESVANEANLEQLRKWPEDVEAALILHMHPDNPWLVTSEMVARSVPGSNRFWSNIN